jgi:osomolarity two-component system, phosphorelay intermediate protein YPD1
LRFQDDTVSSASMPDFGDNVDVATFSQILEMDEDDSERDFSKPLVFGFFEQATETFDKMESAL